MSMIKRIATVLLLTPVSLFALDLDLATEPLAVKTAPVKPNVMLLLDDSGSMNANDVFYTPGFDFTEDYQCAAGSTVLHAGAGKVVKPTIIKNGLLTFTYDQFSASSPTEYVLSEGGGTYPVEIQTTGSGSSGSGSGSTTHNCNANSLAVKYCTGSLDSNYNCSNNWANKNDFTVKSYGFMNSSCSNNQGTSVTNLPSGYACRAYIGKKNNSSASKNGCYTVDEQPPVIGGNGYYFKPSNLTYTASEEQTVVFDTNLSGAQGSWTKFKLDVPEGATSIVIETYGGSGDADLYVKFGSEPTTTSYHCRPYQWGNDESCSVTSDDGTYYIAIRGYYAYSGLTVKASYVGPAAGGDDDDDDVEKLVFQKACFDPQANYKVKIQNSSFVCSGAGEERKCQITNGNTTDEYSGNFLNWYFSSSSNDFFSFAQSQLPHGGFVKNLAAPATDFRMSGQNVGTKQNTAGNHQRMQVAKDVAAILVSGTKDFRMGLASYGSKTPTSGNNTYGGDIEMELLELGNKLASSQTGGTEDATSIDNRKKILTRLGTLNGNNGTPLAESMASIARYYAFGGSEDIYGSQSAAELFKTEFNGDSTIYVMRRDGSYVGDIRNATVPNTTSSTLGSSDIIPPIDEKTFCRKNFTVALTDGEATADSGLSSQLKAFYNEPSSEPQDSDNNNNNTILDDYVDDVIKATYELDLRPDIDNFNGDEVTNNITTYMIAFGQSLSGSLDSFEKVVSHGDGGAFSATNGNELAQAFADITNAINSKGQSITAVALSSVAQLQTENTAYQASYDTQFWAGKLSAFDVDKNGYFTDRNGQKVRDTSNVDPEWEAGDLLNNRLLFEKTEAEHIAAVNSRKIYTRDRNGNGIEFLSGNFSSFSDEMKADLKASVSTTDTAKLIDYVRGNIRYQKDNPFANAELFDKRLDIQASSGEIYSFSNGSILGDIIHSSPVYVSSPARPWSNKPWVEDFGTEANRYKKFQQVQADRPATIYVGANDGMFHAFNGETTKVNGVDAGAEMFAYIPDSVASSASDRGLHYMAQKGSEHRYLVDSMVTASEIFVNYYGESEPEWRTVIAAGLRGGGKGLFALDVTCPPNNNLGTCSNESFNKNNVLWEFSSVDDIDVGYTYSEPVIAKVNYQRTSLGGVDPNANGNGRWAAIVGNGYESENGRAVLYILFMDALIGGGTNWVEGVDYLKLYANHDGAFDPSSQDSKTNKNGLSTPTAVDFTKDGVIDRVYVGDLKGQLWSFDIEAKITEDEYKNSRTDDSFPWKANKLFTTKDNGSGRQPITTAPMVGRHPDLKYPADIPNLFIVFGTGLYHQDKDIVSSSSAFDLQTVYAVHDRDVFELTHNKTSYGMPALEPRTFELNSDGTRNIVGDPVDLGKQYGWFVDLFTDDGDGSFETTEREGERIVFNPILANQLFVFNSIIPTGAQCSDGSSGWTMFIDWHTGLNAKFGTFDRNNDGVIDKNDAGGSGFFNATVGSQIGRGGDNIFDSSGETVRSRAASWGFTETSRHLGWEEKFRDGVLK